ncbi:MAG: MBL fold metallo-hydrolase [Deltaproteobacteria bacterium]|nr:MBL fold metallo-hydrolase [Deltaproteobacteria bacterium]
MIIKFLGTGSAWQIPEYSCQCRICQTMRQLGELRTRSAIYVQTVQENILIDCGPDIKWQMNTWHIPRPDAVLITHEHGDHYLGLDDLLSFRRSVTAAVWTPIPVYASAETFKRIDLRFGYLFPDTLEKRPAEPGAGLLGLKTSVVPFRTFHGQTAPGSLGYVLTEVGPQGRIFRLAYTSDFSKIAGQTVLLSQIDLFIIQSNWLHEPLENRPNHMSLQNALEYIKEWRPKRVYLIHISDQDRVPGDPWNELPKKYRAKAPLAHPLTGQPYPVPTCQSEWQSLANEISQDFDLGIPITVTYDGLTVDSDAI